MLKFAVSLVAAIALCGCTHLKGVVVDAASGRPARTAVLSVGRPDGIAIYAVHPVDSNGKFDFQLGPTDEDNLYLYDSTAPALTERKIDRTEFGQNMKLKLDAPPKGEVPMPRLH
jgi:hypothetical protein